MLWSDNYSNYWHHISAITPLFKVVHLYPIITTEHTSPRFHTIRWTYYTCSLKMELPYMKAVLLSQTIYRYTLLVNTKNLTESYMFSTYYNIAATPLSHSISYNKNLWQVQRKFNVWNNKRLYFCVCRQSIVSKLHNIESMVSLLGKYNLKVRPQTSSQISTLVVSFNR